MAYGRARHRRRPPRRRQRFARRPLHRVAGICAYITAGLRRALLIEPPLAEQERPRGEAGLLLLDHDNRISRADATALAWLRQLPNARETLPPVITAAAARARQLAAGEGDRHTLARARVRADSGVWLLIRASMLGDDEQAVTVVTIEPAGPHDLAPLTAEAYDLPNRERTVTQLVAQGLSTAAIAQRLHLSPWTVQDHAKSIFEKVAAAGRGEHAPAPVGTISTDSIIGSRRQPVVRRSRR